MEVEGEEEDLKDVVQPGPRIIQYQLLHLGTQIKVGDHYSISGGYIIGIKYKIFLAFS